MGKAYKCERCGSYSEHEPKTRLVDYEGGFGTKQAVARRGEIWLCSRCDDSFREFLDGE